jgi:hypothetical protein
MRRSTLLTTLALATSALVLASPSSAVPPLDDVRSTDRAGQPKCTTGLVIATDDGRVRYDIVDRNKVTASRPSQGKFGFKVKAWGFYDDIDGKKTDVFQLNAITSKGDRKVSLSFTGNKKIGLSSTPYSKASGFKPVLFADGYTFYAYIVTKTGQLQRWTLTRYPGGKVRYASKVVLDKGLDLTSLQTTTVFKLKGAYKEVLYGTTADGALLQFTVPLKKPAGMKTRTIVDSGLEGVQELAWSSCNDDLAYTSLIAVDPDAGVAQWVTVKDSNTKPKGVLQGRVKGGDFEGITALF